MSRRNSLRSDFRIFRNIEASKSGISPRIPTAYTLSARASDQSKRKVMYLDGQLPHGPISSNLGGQVNPDGVSALDGSGDPPIVSPMPQDLSGNTFWSTPAGGDVLISPSLATADGIVQYPINRMRSYKRGDNPPGRNAPRGWAAGNPADWAPASCGLGHLAPGQFEEHYGHAPPDEATCIKIQCGAIPQSQVPAQLMLDCGNDGYAGPRTCKDPLCAPSCPTQLIAPGPPVAPLVIRQPAEVAAYVPTSWEACPGYGADGSLITLRGDGGRNAGLNGCCQSGYQVAEDFSVPSLMSPWLLLAGLAGLALLTKGGR